MGIRDDILKFKQKTEGIDVAPTVKNVIVDAPKYIEPVIEEKVPENNTVKIEPPVRPEEIEIAIEVEKKEPIKVKDIEIKVNDTSEEEIKEKIEKKETRASRNKYKKRKEKHKQKNKKKFKAKQISLEGIHKPVEEVKKEEPKVEEIKIDTSSVELVPRDKCNGRILTSDISCIEFDLVYERLDSKMPDLEEEILHDFVYSIEKEHELLKVRNYSFDKSTRQLSINFDLVDHDGNTVKPLKEIKLDLNTIDIMSGVNQLVLNM